MTNEMLKNDQAGQNEMSTTSSNVCKALGEWVSDELKASSNAKWENVV